MHTYVPEPLAAVAWDFDNSVYSYKAMPGDLFNRVAEEVVTRLVRSYLPDMSQEQACELAWQNFRTAGDCYSVFVPLIAERGFDPDETRRNLFRDFHTDLYRTVKTRMPDYFDHAREALPAFEAAVPYVRHGILSHGYAEGWIKPALGDTSLLPFFQPDAIWGLEECGGVHKHESPAALRRMIAQLGVEPSRAFFADDITENLKVAREISEAKIVYIHQGSPLKRMPSYIDFEFRNAKEFMNYVVESVVRPYAQSHGNVYAPLQAVR